MRILVLTQYFFPHAGGSQEYILQLYKELISQDTSTKVDIICYNTDNAPSFEKIENLNIYRLPCIELLPGQFAIANPFSLIRILSDLKTKNKTYDFVNSHTRFFDNSWWAPVVAKFFSAKSILTDHCASHPVHENTFINLSVKVFDTALAYVIPKLYDHVTTISQATTTFLKQYGNKFEMPVFYSGVDQAFGTATAMYTLPFKKTDATKLVTFVGRMIASKNPELALAVAQKVTKKRKDVHFIFAGSGPEFKKLSSQKNNHIHFVGKLNRSELAGLLQVSDILIHPSKHHEGLPITLLEAGASKVAVVASNAGGTEEVIKNSTTGIITTATTRAFTNQVEILLDTSTLAKKLASELNKKVVREFSWKKTARAYLYFLQSNSQ